MLGLVPVVGDFAGAVVSAYLLRLATRARIPRALRLRMLGLLVADLAIGAVPVAGDLFDFAFRSNTRFTPISKRAPAINRRGRRRRPSSRS